jgi:hypothetical protein
VLLGSPRSRGAAASIVAAKTTSAITPAMSAVLAPQI